MSATINWRPVLTKERYFPCNTPSHFIESMKKAGYNFPCILCEEDINKLSGMASVSGDDNIYEKIIEQIDKHGRIEVSYGF